jgi:hypothetical protein
MKFINAFVNNKNKNMQITNKTNKGKNIMVVEPSKDEAHKVLVALAKIYYNDEKRVNMTGYKSLDDLEIDSFLDAKESCIYIVKVVITNNLHETIFFHYSRLWDFLEDKEYEPHFECINGIYELVNGELIEKEQ